MLDSSISLWLDFWSLPDQRSGVLSRWSLCCFRCKLNSRSQMDWLDGWRWKDWGFSCRSGRGLSGGREEWLGQLSRADFCKPSAHSPNAPSQSATQTGTNSPAFFVCPIISIQPLLWLGTKSWATLSSIWLAFGRWSPVRRLRKRRWGSESGRIARGRAAAQHVSSYLTLSMWGLDTQDRELQLVFCLSVATYWMFCCARDCQMSIVVTLSHVIMSRCCSSCAVIKINANPGSLY